ncbi:MULTISPECIES: class Ib ribonucleoside-diphosphate reductase assembly flavoprotein NrdI [unclassified Actinomyces]|uniref:class Ib ribonucleoside-diphosphate reductase assembly flavoprotein NrdI n=1 Tax=unclassified Actinomyces TaxID=2609248 RepID=UPI0020178D77|nr:MULTISPECIES: class Ib ribonucleoside-diphosphate reductase assembly flavoprotein NrdI [unclassified Actinomyces]MCL3777672.1 class Ib ribonucleoside-diphosphate reductase assembly flavoprotein NrdI [Actinomyces sp. AC-20-1]MCL3789776.1 class Ib ribonucleoside-diphosphate reductase assembly flavoprotein NrdI [Actinomyces sp. 187325]MCL3791971.1 class Ib ribonucleoside-diphosphate reductase assembly flavoprotein NrdI [Actinomyces sp. 186855]MCL3794633.1 class Ib ribonucleoside-diphosphate red
MPSPATPSAVTVLPEDESHDLVYFSSASQNTHRFVQRVGRPATRIPLRPRTEGMIQVSRPYVILVPTYGGGDLSKALPRQVAQFLNIPANRRLLRGVISSGNTNFGTAYCAAGPIIAGKCHVPDMYRFELLGTDDDVATVRQGLERFWATSPLAA